MPAEEARAARTFQPLTHNSCWLCTGSSLRLLKHSHECGNKLHLHLPQHGAVLGCILLGLFWLFLFRFRNNRIHGISISKRTPILETEYPWWGWPENHYVCTRAGGRVGFPAKNFPKERVFCLFRVNRIPFILFILLSGAEWYSVHSENGIAPKRTQIPSIPSIPIPE